MKGLELSKKYYEEYGKEMLSSEFQELLPYIAVGLAGSGSECLGFDDDISEDHDFEPGFCIFLPDEDVVDRKAAFKLERAYAKLPDEFLGYKRNKMSPVGGDRHGGIRTKDFFRARTGSDNEYPDLYEWLHIPSYALREAVSGEIFEDNYGQFTRIRENLADMPEDVRLKRLAGNVLIMAQSGQYNYPRIIKRGEKAAAQMAIFEFVKSTVETVFLLNKAYMPYYKWAFYAMRQLDILNELEEPLYMLMTTGNEDEESWDKYNCIEEISAKVAGELMEQNITKAVCKDLEKHAYSVNDHIADGSVRNLHILYAV